MIHQMIDGNAGLSLLTLHIGMIVFGLVSCFFGYRVFRFLLGVWGFIGGFTLGVWFLRGIDVGPFVQLLGAIVAGIFGVFLVTLLYLLGVFLFGAGFGLLVASVILQNWPAIPQWFAVIILGVLGGAAAVALQSPLIKLFTAFSGAWVVIASFVGLLSGQSLGTYPFRIAASPIMTLAIYGAWLLLGAFGTSIQMRLARRRRAMEDQEY
jgi:hypothetical protein